MWIVRIIIGVLVAVVIAGSAAGQVDYNDLSDYYGFGEIEIIKLDRNISNLIIADFDGDGRNDIAVANNRKAKIELLIQKETVGPGEQAVVVDAEDIDVNLLNPVTRFDKQSVAVSQKVYSLACGDLNSDGKTDLAFYGEPKGLYIILQKKDKTNADNPKTLSWRKRKRIRIDDGLSVRGALICADLNNDGADDLALAARDAVYVILQKEDGTLAEPVKYATAARTLGIKTGDLNGDNIRDLVLLTDDSEKPMYVRLGLKTGQLGPQMRLFIEKPHKLQLANVDGIAGDEILSVDAGSGRLLCYKFGAESGSGDSDWPMLFYPLASGEGSAERNLVVGDFDGDGLEDVVVSEPGAAELVFYKQIMGVGLAEPVTFPAFADITSLSVADFSKGAGSRVELAVLSVKEKALGLSRFEDDRLTFPEPIQLSGEPLAMDLSDVDRDGSIDCVYIVKDGNDRYLRVIYDLASHVKRTAEERLDERKLGLKLEKLASNPDGLKVVDVDQDLLGDVLIFVKYEAPILVRQVEKGMFEVVDSPDAQASLIKEAGLSSIAVADVAGDEGRELLVAQKNFARSLVFADGKSWKILDQYNANSRENKISVVRAFDIETAEASGMSETGERSILLLDGQKGQLQILKSGADKTYRFEKQLNVGRWNAAGGFKMLLTRLTGDDAKNVLLFDSEKFALITRPVNGVKFKDLELQFSYETKIKDGMYGNLTSGDINSDGRADIVMIEYKHNHVEILALDSQVKPVPAMRFKIFEQKSYRDSNRGKSSVEPRELTIADVTGDGKNDLVTIIHDRIIIYPQD